MLALIYLGLAICVGERLCSRYYRFVSVAHRWATGALGGLLLSACFTYLAGRHFADTSHPLLWGNLLFFATAAILLVKCPKRDPSMMEPPAPGSVGWDWVTLGLYLALACWMMFATLDFKNGTLLIGITQWSDYGPNTAIVRSFSAGHNFPAEYPHFAGEPIRYHFLFYFLAGNLEFLGLNLVWSLNLLSILTLVCLLALVMALGQLLFKSRAVGRLASALFFFHGTLNLVPFLRKQTSFKGTLQAIYNLRDYLTSGYPYRGEDWGIWTQVVFVNQRHLASAIGIFLIVLFFLFDRYLECARQKELIRASRTPVGPRRWSPALIRRSLAARIPARFVKRGRKEEIASGDGTTSDKPASPGQPPPELDTASISEGQLSGAPESLEGSSPGANLEGEAEARPSDTVTDLESSSQESDISLVNDPQPVTPQEPLAESPPAANLASGGEAKTPDTLADDEQAPLPSDTTSGSEGPPSDTVNSLEESADAPPDTARGEAQTLDTLAYDEYMRQGVTSEGEVKESEALEFSKQSSQEDDALAAAEAPATGSRLPVEETPLDPDTRPVSEAQLPQPSISRASRGFIADLIHDNLVSGHGFIFSGLLIGLLPFWNAPVFTAAFAVFLFLFVLFPCRRYMVGLAVTTAVIALPQILALRSGNVRAGPALIHWGYTLGNVPVLQVVKYLGFTFGVKWVLILVGLLFFSWRNLRLFIAIFSLFLLTFCFQFSEEALANHKFLNIWLVLANLFVAYGLWRLWHARIMGWAIPSRLVAILLISPILAGGIIDFFPIRNAGFVYTNLANDRLIKWLQTETKPDAVFLTDKFVNHPILLSGRRIWMGYTYFTWSAGYDLPKREIAYRQMWESKNAHQVFTLLKANGIDYVAFDSTVRGTFKNNSEQQVYAPNFKKVFEGSDYYQLTIYKVPENADFVPAPSAPLPPGAQVTGVSAFEGGKGKENGRLDFPRGLTADNAGNMLVADTNNDRLQKFSAAGVFLSIIGKSGSGPGEFREPGGIAVDSDGNIYVADAANNRVQKLKPDGTFVAQWKGPEPGFKGPRDIGIGPGNSIYVVDQGHSRIVKLDSDGKVQAVWGAEGRNDGQLAGPTSVAVDGKNDRVYVADPSNKRIEIFDTNGKFLAQWKVEEWGAPTGWYFQDLLIDVPAGRLYASSPTDEILVFDLAGKRMKSLRPAPPDKLEGASGLALIKGKLYVLNTYAGRVSAMETK